MKKRLLINSPDGYASWLKIQNSFKSYVKCDRWLDPIGEINGVSYMGYDRIGSFTGNVASLMKKRKRINRLRD